MIKTIYIYILDASIIAESTDRRCSFSCDSEKLRYWRDGCDPRQPLFLEYRSQKDRQVEDIRSGFMTFPYLEHMLLDFF